MSLSNLPADGWIRRLLPVVLVLFSLAAPAARAQTPPSGAVPGDLPQSGATPAVSTVLIDSDPAGAVITLKGPYVLVGQTPWLLDRDLRGLYQVEARLPGFEPWRREVVLGMGGPQKIKIKLERRTTGRAFGRSLLFPGWGQIYRGSKGKGAFLASAWMLALGASLYTEIVYQGRLDDFKAARSDFEARRQLGESWDSAYALVQRRSGRADQAYGRRTIAVGAAAGIYALSALDVLFFGHQEESLTATGASSDRWGTAPEDGGWSWSAGISPASVHAGLSLKWR
jgi:hypothetical protein